MIKFTVPTGEFKTGMAALNGALRTLEWKGNCLITIGKSTLTLEASSSGGYFKRTIKGIKAEGKGTIMVQVPQLMGVAYPAEETTFTVKDKSLTFSSGRMRGSVMALSEEDALDRIEDDIPDGIIMASGMLNTFIRTILFQPATPDIPMTLRLTAIKAERRLKAIAFDPFRAVIFDHIFDKPKKLKPKDEKKSKKKDEDDEPTYDALHVDIRSDVDYAFPTNLTSAMVGLFDGLVHIGSNEKMVKISDDTSVLYHPYSSTDETEEVTKLFKSLKKKDPYIEARIQPELALPEIASACSISGKGGVITLTPDAAATTMQVKVVSDYAKTKTEFDLSYLKVRRKGATLNVPTNYFTEFLSQVKWFAWEDKEALEGVSLKVWDECIMLSTKAAAYIIASMQE